MFIEINRKKNSLSDLNVRPNLNIIWKKIKNCPFVEVCNISVLFPTFNGPKFNIE